MNRFLPQKAILTIMPLVLLLSAKLLFSQNLKKPVLQFSAPCASENFNTFKVTFEWDPPLVASANSFILELSDKNGSFANPTVLSSVSDKNTVFKFDFSFSFPTTVAGNEYKVRVKSTNPEKISPASDAFSAYYVNVNTSLILNNYQDVAVCDGSSVTLEVNNFPNEPAYNWYRNTTLISGQKSSKLTTNQPGLYFVEVDYGYYCSTSTASNIVEISNGAAMGVDFVGEKEVSLCNGAKYILEVNIDDDDLEYSWYKDGSLIVTNDSHTYLIDSAVEGFEGKYHVVVNDEDGDGCSETTSTVTVTSDDFNLALNQSGESALLPGNSFELKATTNARGPVYQWYKEGVAISGATASTYRVDSPGRYRVKVTQKTGCEFSKESEEVTFSYPQSFTARIEADPNYSSCETSSASIGLKEIRAVMANGQNLVLSSADTDRFSFEWLKNGQSTGNTSKNINITNYLQNGDYQLKINLDAFEAVSNTQNVQLKINENLEISIQGTLSCSGKGEVELSSSINSPDFKFTWYKNGVPVTGSDAVLKTTTSGTYRVVAEAFGCKLSSADVVINPFNAGDVTIDVPENLQIPEGVVKTITASGADYYQWFNSENILISASASVNIGLEGTYYLKAFVDDCEVVKTITVTYLFSTVVPNVISPNGDGFNDFWVLPKSYSFQSDVSVSIYNENGTLLFTATNYQNNWPESTSFMGLAKKPVLYYTITKGKQTIKQGTITVIK